MSDLREIWRQVKALFAGAVDEDGEPIQRSIADVDAWDGAASNYDDTAAYCRACLIDVNPAGEDKKQSLCLLPVKAPGGTAYVRQAIHAAAGGHGISQAKKPDGVSADDWAAAVKKAANKLLSLYREMDEEAPASVTAAAGKERDIEWGRIYELIYTELAKVYPPDPDGWATVPYVRLFEDTTSGGLYLILQEQGKLFRRDVGVTDAGVTVGPPVEVAEAFRPLAVSRTTVARQADGKRRWVSVSCSAVVNRDLEIDSTALFDDFVAHFRPGCAYRCFMHLESAPFRTGEVDFMAREGALLITSGTYYDDNPLAEAEIARLAEDPAAWGESISYDPIGPPDYIEVAGIQIPVYKSGVFRHVATCPADVACAWFTRIVSSEEVQRMDGRILDALKRLLKDDDKAVEFAGLVDELNRTIAADQLIVRVTGPDAPASPADPASAATVEPLPAVELDDLALAAIVARVQGALGEDVAAQVRSALAADLTGMQTGVAGVQARLTAVETRLAALEQTDEEKRAEWQADLPAAARLRVTYRPRVEHAAEPPAAGPDKTKRGKDYASKAAATMNGLPSLPAATPPKV